ncbi:MAG: gamma-glutamyl-gamma-aminobutyrate hydrolase family protein [Myxococcaceae bacterium]
MAVLFIENHDSFSFSIIDYLKRLGAEVKIYDHKQKPNLKHVSHLVLGPGPGIPENSGFLMQWLDLAVQTDLAILGICLGHQAIGRHFGADLVRAPRAIHGEVDLITHSSAKLFKNIQSPTPVTRYHSLVLTNLPPVLTVDAYSEDGQIMAISHVSKPIHGLQFHPESFLSEQGLGMLENFLRV